MYDGCDGCVGPGLFAGYCQKMAPGEAAWTSKQPSEANGFYRNMKEGAGEVVFWKDQIAVGFSYSHFTDSQPIENKFAGFSAYLVTASKIIVCPAHSGLQTCYQSKEGKGTGLCYASAGKFPNSATGTRYVEGAGAAAWDAGGYLCPSKKHGEKAAQNDDCSDRAPCHANATEHYFEGHPYAGYHWCCFAPDNVPLSHTYLVPNDLRFNDTTYNPQTLAKDLAMGVLPLF